MVRTCLMAIVATLLVVSPTLAQAAKPEIEVKTRDVKTRSGGIVVKKVIQNGKVVDEDVKVFGDLDDETRKRLLELTGKCCPGTGRPEEGEKGKTKCDDTGTCAGKSGVFFFGPGDECPLGDEVRKRLEKALKEHGLGHGRHIFRFRGPGTTGHGDGKMMGDRIRKEVEKALRSHGHGGGHFFRGRQGRFMGPQVRELLKKHLAPKRAVPVRPAPGGDKATLDAIRRLERNIERMQRELKALKRGLTQPRPIQLGRTGAPVREL